MKKNLLRNHEAERNVLSACLVEPVALRKAGAILSPADFHDADHRAIYAACLDVMASGAVVDGVTIGTHLGDDLPDLVQELADNFFTAVNIVYHAELVQACATRRRLIETLDHATKAITSGSDEALASIAGTVQSALSSAVSKGGRKGFGVVTGEEIIALADSIVERRTAREAGQIIGVATGYPEIDDQLFGFKPAELVIVCARPKGCKTALCLNITVNAITEQGLSGGFVSTEMLRPELLERAGNQLAKVTTRQTAAGLMSDREVERFATQLNSLAGRLHIDDEAFPTLDDVIARSIDLKARHPEIAFLVVDYLQRVTKRMKGRRGDEEIAAVTAGIKALGKELRIPIFAPAQVNYKDSDRRDAKSPTLADIQGSSSFAQDGNFVFLLHRPGLFDPDPALASVLQVELAASRRTDNFTTNLVWHGEFQAIDSPLRRLAIRRSEAA